MGKVVVGVCGGIAAYKAPELARLLGKAGHVVDVVLTESATRLVSAAALAAAAGKTVASKIDRWRASRDGSDR